MGANSPFRKHGTFIYEVPAVIQTYGTTALAIDAMQEAGMTHAWVRIHGRTPYNKSSKKIISDFIAELGKVGIGVAGWGWCHGDDPLADAKMAKQEMDDFKLKNYVADIEHGVHGANWQPKEITAFCTALRPAIDEKFGITTFPLIDWHEPELMQAALPFVDFFNPQVYWHNHPSKKMLKQFKRPNGQAYTADDPKEYADLCLDRWDKMMGATPKDIVITGQAYWGEGVTPFPQSEAEEKLADFVDNWAGFGRVVGLNWWHLGGSKAMSHRMLNSITKAKLGKKPYKK